MHSYIITVELFAKTSTGEKTLIKNATHVTRAKYYERFFEIVKKETTSVNRGQNRDFDTRIATGEKEVSKIRADVFFRLKEGEFITYADGKDKKVQFSLPTIGRGLPGETKFTKEDLYENFEQIYKDVRLIFGGGFSQNQL